MPPLAKGALGYPDYERVCRVSSQSLHEIVKVPFWATLLVQPKLRSVAEYDNGLIRTIEAVISLEGVEVVESVKKCSRSTQLLL
jgi:hypothetical protein